MTRRNAFPVFLVLVLVAAVVGSLLLYNTTGRNLSTPALVTSVQRLNELATVRHTVQKIVAITEQKQPVGEERLLLIVQGRVVAGIDLSKLQDKDIFQGPDAVTIRLPEPKILQVYIDEKGTQVWDRQVTWWTPWVPYNPQLEQKARQQALAEMEKAAVDSGILNQARTNAQLAITNLLQAVGVQNVRFEGRS
jgi:hypothetical protein